MSRPGPKLKVLSQHYPVVTGKPLEKLNLAGQLLVSTQDFQWEAKAQQQIELRFLVLIVLPYSYSTKESFKYYEVSIFA